MSGADRLREVLKAADALLGAREDQMVTSVEWDELERAVQACQPQAASAQREESFAVEDGFLVRRVAPRRGEPYEHRCPLAAYEAVAHAIDEMAGAAFALDDLRAALDLPWTRVAVALAFMKERGCVVPAHGRKHKAAPGNSGGGVHLDAMLDAHALREGAAGDIAGSGD